MPSTERILIHKRRNQRGTWLSSPLRQLIRVPGPPGLHLSAARAVKAGPDHPGSAFRKQILLAGLHRNSLQDLTLIQEFVYLKGQLQRPLGHWVQKWSSLLLCLGFPFISRDISDAFRNIQNDLLCVAGAIWPNAFLLELV